MFLEGKAHRREQDPSGLRRREAVPHVAMFGFGGRVGMVTGEKMQPGLGLAVRTYLLLHPALQQHRDAGLDGEGDLPAADGEVLFQGLPEGRLLHPGLCGGREGCKKEAVRGERRSPCWAMSFLLYRLS